LFRPSLARIFISKAINGPIPKRFESFDENVFPEWDPNIVNDKVPYKKILEMQI